MNYITKNTQIIKHNRLYGALLAGILLSPLSCTQTSQSRAPLEIDPTLQQAVFTSPESAANTLVQALSDEDVKQLSKILSTDFLESLPLGDVTDEDLAAFLSAWKKAHTLLPQGDKKRLIAVGKDKWTLPIPIIEDTSGWHFDLKEGLNRMRIRRIGRNELSAMQAVLAYYDAQVEYAEQDHNNNGVLEYAQRFISTSGSQDGLFWETNADGPLSPLGPLLADRSPGGGYHGYYYKILTAQGEHAKGGAYSYLTDSPMLKGFALIAWPEDYGESGIMSFLVSHEGIVYEQNLGKNTANISKETSTYNPSSDWIPVQDVYAPQVGIVKK